MKRNLVGKILGKIKIFVQDFVPIRTALFGGKNKCQNVKVGSKVAKFLKKNQNVTLHLGTDVCVCVFFPFILDFIILLPYVMTSLFYYHV